MLQKVVELQAIHEVTTHGKTSYGCIQSTKNVIILSINNNTQVQALLQQDKAIKPSAKGNFAVNKALFNGVNPIESEENGNWEKKAGKTMESESSQSKQQKSDAGKSNDIVEQIEAKKSESS